MKNKELPENLVNVMVTYKKTVTFGPYNSQSRKETVTRKGFYHALTGTFSIPPEWTKFRMGYTWVDMPNGFGGDHLKPENIIKWEPIKE